MEYDDSPKAKEMGERARRFIDEEVLPVEREAVGTGSKISMAQTEELREKARKETSTCLRSPRSTAGRDWTSETCCRPSSRRAPRNRSRSGWSRCSRANSDRPSR